MRRKEKEITERNLIDTVISKALVCRLALCKEKMPYVIPVSFGYDGKNIFIHTASEGKKIDFISDNNNVCFEFEHDVKLVTNETTACSWSFSFYSVVGFGKIFEITAVDDKIAALNQIMIHYSGKSWEVNPNSVEKTRVWKIEIDSITGKQSKDKIIS
jgi:nitroimidazol reductase NimA-like FMN-containing flavoprotein (pyridoxamine 5'-phosphate oxidase superfamily)